MEPEGVWLVVNPDDMDQSWYEFIVIQLHGMLTNQKLWNVNCKLHISLNETVKCHLEENNEPCLLDYLNISFMEQRYFQDW